MHTNPEYFLAVTQLGSTDGRLCGVGFALTLSNGNRLVCEAILREQQRRRSERDAVLRIGYPGCDTSIGWMAYDDARVRELTQRAIDKGFNAFKLKVGSRDHNHGLRRATMLRECVGDAGIVMYDANQQWTLPVARKMCAELANLRPLWIEEPTHPDDVMAHVTLAREIAPVKIATGEHIPNRVVFKDFIQSGAMHYVQADCTRLAGVSEFLTVSLLAKKFNPPAVPHVGDMGQVHQHLVLFNHVAGLLTAEWKNAMRNAIALMSAGMAALTGATVVLSVGSY